MLSFTHVLGNSKIHMNILDNTCLEDPTVVARGFPDTVCTQVWQRNAANITDEHPSTERWARKLPGQRSAQDARQTPFK